jgi:hypothetical protein
LGPLLGENRGEIIFELRCSNFGPSTAMTTPNEEGAPRALRAQFIAIADDVETTLDLVESEIIGIGHNHPPEAIEAEIISESDVEEVRVAIEALKLQPSESAPTPLSLRAVQTLYSVGSKLLGYIAEKSNIFIDGAMKAAGKEAGKWAVRIPALSIIGSQIMHAAQAALHWIQSLNFRP